MPKKLHAPTVSRYLHHAHGIITRPDFRHEGYRVTGFKLLGSVTIHVMFDSDNTRRRRTEQLWEALQEDGFIGKVDTAEGNITLTERISA